MARNQSAAFRRFPSLQEATMSDDGNGSDISSSQLGQTSPHEHTPSSPASSLQSVGASPEPQSPPGQSPPGPEPDSDVVCEDCIPAAQNLFYPSPCVSKGRGKRARKSDSWAWDHCEEMTPLHPRRQKGEHRPNTTHQCKVSHRFVGFEARHDIVILQVMIPDPDKPGSFKICGDLFTSTPTDRNRAKGRNPSTEPERYKFKTSAAEQHYRAIKHKGSTAWDLAIANMKKNDS